MELMQSDVFVKSAANQAAAGRARAMPGPGKIQRRIKLAFIANPGAPLTIAEGGERAA